VVSVIKKNEYWKEEKEIIPCLRECVRHLIIYIEYREEKRQENCTYENQKKVKRPNSLYSP
jgi:hypothetical protein